MQGAFYLPKNTKCLSHFTNLKLLCMSCFTTSLPVILRWIVELCMICHLKFTLYLWDVIYQNIYSQKFERRSNPYQSSSETDLVKW